MKIEIDLKEFFWRVGIPSILMTINVAVTNIYYDSLTVNAETVWDEVKIMGLFIIILTTVSVGGYRVVYDLYIRKNIE